MNPANNQRELGSKSFPSHSDETAAPTFTLIPTCRTVKKRTQLSQLSHTPTVRQEMYVILSHCICGNLLHSNRKLIQFHEIELVLNF